MKDFHFDNSLGAFASYKDVDTCPCCGGIGKLIVKYSSTSGLSRGYAQVTCTVCGLSTAKCIDDELGYETNAENSPAIRKALRLWNKRPNK